MTIASAYLRDSGGGEQELSIRQQEQRIREWCAENGHQLRTIFKDEARPGSSTIKRTEFHNMITHLTSGAAPEKLLVVWSFSRFARDLNDAMLFKATLRKKGITVTSITDDIPEDPKFASLIEFILDWKNDMFLEDLSEDVKRGLLHILNEHGARAGTPPRGFKREEILIGEHRNGKPHIVCRWVPDDETWNACALAWTMKLEGQSHQKIHRTTGLYKTMSCYSTFFRNPIYKGALKYGELLVEDYYPALVTQEDWERVQLEGKRNRTINDPRKRAARSNSSYLLSGLVYCGECGAPMNGKTVQFKEKQKHPYKYYECARKQRTGGKECSMGKIPAQALENTVLASLKTELQTPIRFFEILRQYQEQSHEDHTTERQAIKQRIEQIRGQIETTANLVIETGSNTLAARLIQMEKEESTLKQQLTTLNMEPGDIDEEVMLNFCLDIARKIETMKPPELRAILLNLLANINVRRIGKKFVGQIQLTAPGMSSNPHSGDLCEWNESPWRHYYVGINIEGSW